MGSPRKFVPDPEPIQELSRSLLSRNGATFQLKNLVLPKRLKQQENEFIYSVISSVFSTFINFFCETIDTFTSTIILKICYGLVGSVHDYQSYYNILLSSSVQHL